MVALWDCVAYCGAVQRLAHCAVVRHRTSYHSAVSSNENLTRQNVPGSCGYACHVLVYVRDSCHGHIRQAVIASVRRDSLLLLSGGYRLALQGVVATARHARDSAGSVMVAGWDSVSLSLLYSRGDCTLIHEALNSRSQCVQIACVGSHAKLNQLGPNCVSVRLDSAQFGCNAHILTPSLDRRQYDFDIPDGCVYRCGGNRQGIIRLHRIGRVN